MCSWFVMGINVSDRDIKFLVDVGVGNKYLKYRANAERCKINLFAKSAKRLISFWTYFAYF